MNALWLAASDTNYGIGIHGVFTSLIEAKAAFPGVWSIYPHNQWYNGHLVTDDNWPVYLIPAQPNQLTDKWLVQDGR